MIHCSNQQKLVKDLKEMSTDGKQAQEMSGTNENC
jgi:hypothetical protein